MSDEKAEGSFTCEVTPVSRWVARFRKLALGSVGVGLFGLIGGFILFPPAAVPIYVLAVGGLLTGLLGHRVAKTRPPDRQATTRAVASAGGITIGDRRIARDEIKDGTVVATPGGALVTLTRKGFLAGPVHFHVGSVAEGRALLDALELGAGKMALRRKVMSPMIHPKFTFPGVLLAFASLFAGGFLSDALPAAGLLAAAFPLWLVSIYVFGMIKRRVTIGADGVRVSWLGKERVIALADIVRVEKTIGTMGLRIVRLHLAGGETFDIQVALRGHNVFEPFDANHEQALIAERIEEAIALGRGAAERTIEGWVQNRSGLDVVDWIAELRLAARLEHRLRGAAHVTDELFRLLDNVTAHPAVRAAAAVALGPFLDAKGRDRLRAVARASAVPRFRVAIEAAADGDERVLADALGELHQDHQLKVRVADDEALLAEAQEDVAAFEASEGVARARD